MDSEYGRHYNHDIPVYHSSSNGVHGPHMKITYQSILFLSNLCCHKGTTPTFNRWLHLDETPACCGRIVYWLLQYDSLLWMIASGEVFLPSWRSVQLERVGVAGAHKGEPVCDEFSCKGLFYRRHWCKCPCAIESMMRG